ncbi:hypothetical protein ACFWYW_26450 [Nonomuraea sp. NPDC059023]|uniref:hypothetical protein n=1 Tax=unclassified Nonomuraea TaxID=2593643 RepID=UPI0036C9E5F8
MAVSGGVPSVAYYTVAPAIAALGGTGGVRDRHRGPLHLGGRHRGLQQRGRIPAGFNGTDPAVGIAAWVERTYDSATVAGTTVFDLTRPR